MADPELEDVKEALKRFRSDILQAFAKLDVEVTALRWAVIEAPVTEARLNELRKRARENVERYRERYAQSIGFAHETR
jgi:hypothetical protein